MQNQRKHEKIDFVTIKISIGYRVACKRCPFALQNMPFYTSKDAFLQCKRRPFRTWFATYWCSDGYKAVFRVISSDIYFMLYKFL